MRHDQAFRLANQLRERCVRDPLVGTSDISVTLQDDAVQLRGTVSNTAAKDRIGQLARGLAPGLAIENGIVVSVTDLADDERLTQRANSWIANHFPGDAAAMGVTVEQGKAILRGEWPTLAALKEARQAIGKLPGIKAVDTSSVTLPYRMAIPEVGVVPIDQRDTLNRIEERLQAGYRLGDWVDARMAAGTVELVGIVDGPDEAREVAEIAAQTPGVRRVVNRLQFRQCSTDQDRQAEARIKEAWGHPDDAVSPADLHLFVVDGHAYVTGQVDTPEARQQALAMVRTDAGIRQVTDRITIVTRRSRPESGLGTETWRRTG